MRGARAVLFPEYPKCSTCKKAKKWLESAGVVFEERNIVEQNPSIEELRTWWESSGLLIQRFFNTLGMLYRELNVKQKFDDGMTDEEALELLATSGMLVKRPLLIIDGVPTTPGFKEDDWRAVLGV
ncbi:Spx/MgsR family RNA polymerase-binding regulatory protein [Eggerthellaceae bacterium zg-887]|nr:Spx/MgsR family RNA polymerase-binding regulatory protein [Xiamenia xianingshaonis]